jgi:hypothetical protein
MFLSFSQEGGFEKRQPGPSWWRQSTGRGLSPASAAAGNWLTLQVEGFAAVAPQEAFIVALCGRRNHA